MKEIWPVFNLASVHPGRLIEVRHFSGKKPKTADDMNEQQDRHDEFHQSGYPFVNLEEIFDFLNEAWFLEISQ